MLIVASLGAIVLLLLPVAVVLVWRARRDRPLWALALDLPLAVAVDLLLVLCLTRIVRLELATFASRGLWLAAGAAIWLRRRPDAPARPSGLGRRELGLGALGAVVGFALSAQASWPYSIWDRKFHTPLVSSLRGQRLPFENVFVKGEILHYHFAGDVHAAMVQSLSFGVIHSSLALSIAHDVLFALIGAAIVLLLQGLAGRRGGLWGLAVTLAALLSGPLTLGRDPKHPYVDGYSVINYLSMSFRPHDALAGLFYVGFLGAVLARVWRRPEGPQMADTAPALLAAAAGLAISDETSLGILGLSLGLVWLLWPEVVHPRRGVGALLFLGLAVALIGPNLAFAASLSPGAQGHVIRLVPWRSPGCYTPTLLLSTSEGRRMLLFDMAPTVVAWLGAAGAIVWWRRPRSGPIFAILTLMLLLSLFALTRVDVNHDALESHRFVTCVLFVMPLLGAALLLASADEASPIERVTGIPHARLLVPAALVIAGAALGGASTISWVVGVLPVRGHRHNHFFTTQDLYAINCRKELGATLGERAVPHYLSKAIWYAYAGCHPTQTPGKNENRWATTIGNPYFDKEALRVVDSKMSAAEPLTVICPRPLPARADPVCSWVVAHAHCEDLGTAVSRCTLAGSERAAAREALR
jgi:hypothetical protein